MVVKLDPKAILNLSTPFERSTIELLNTLCIFEIGRSELKLWPLEKYNFSTFEAYSFQEAVTLLKFV